MMGRYNEGSRRDADIRHSRCGSILPFYAPPSVPASVWSLVQYGPWFTAVFYQLRQGAGNVPMQLVSQSTDSLHAMLSCRCILCCCRGPMMTYKQFISDLDDDVSPEEAERR